MQKKHFHNEYLRIPAPEDLAAIKYGIINDVQNLLCELSGVPVKEWLKTKEVGKFLGLTPITLQALRNQGILPFTRIGGVVYYNTGAILKMLEQHKVNKL